MNALRIDIREEHAVCDSKSGQEWLGRMVEVGLEVWDPGVVERGRRLGRTGKIVWDLLFIGSYVLGVLRLSGEEVCDDLTFSLQSMQHLPFGRGVYQSQPSRLFGNLWEEGHMPVGEYTVWSVKPMLSRVLHPQGPPSSCLVGTYPVQSHRPAQTSASAAAATSWFGIVRSPSYRGESVRTP
jgi:hypothetical protein